MLKLRPYQQECIDAIPNEGAYLIQMATGLGKSVVFSRIPTNGKTLIISHREELVRQPLRYFDCKTSIEMASNRADQSASVISASVQSLCRRLDQYDPNLFDVVVIDECFPSNTIVNGKQLQYIEIGDIIQSYNHNTGNVENKKVLHVFKSIPIGIVAIKLKKGKELICTPNHPIYTQRGYVCACELKQDDELYLLRERDYQRINERPRVQIQKTWSSLLFCRMYSKILLGKFFPNHVKNKLNACSKIVCSDEVKQSNGKSRNQGENVCKIKGNWTSPKDTMRKWDRIDSTATSITYCIERIKSTFGICCSNKNGARKEWISNLLQNRYCYSNVRDSYRGGREQPRFIIKTISRFKENRFFRKFRVENVEIQKQTSDGTFGGLCPDGYVYNIEVEGNNNYFANGYLVHNCHHSSSPTYRKIIDHFNPRLLLGFTATPNRSDSVRMDDIYQSIIYKKDLRWGITNGYLSDIFCRRAFIGFNLSAVKTRMGDYAPGELDKAMDGTADAIAQVYRDHAVGSTLIFAVSVRHAEEIAGKINGAVVVTGETDHRDKIVSDFTDGKIPCIVNCMVFTEGTDIPRVETIIVARPTQSDSLYTQMVGRGLRPFKGKDKLNLIDCVGVTGRNSLCTAPTLLGIDLSNVPEKKLSELDGNLFELPQKVEILSDCPESWIKNIKIVDLWSKEQRHELHNVNYFKMPNGDLVCSLPDRQSIVVPCQDELGKTVWRGKLVPMQDALDNAYLELCTRFSANRIIWDLSSIRRWGKSPASEKQIKIIQRRLKKFDPKDLNKMEASAILNRLFTK